MVIEAVIEDLALKQNIFADLEKACTPECILSTNTSTIDITKIAAKMKAPERIIGAHFFSPAHIMQLFEIVRTEATPAQVVLDTLALSKRLKKVPVVVGNCTGFAVNRVFFPYTMSAFLLADLGVDIYKVDQAIKAWGMPMGPFRLSDLVGGDVGLHVGSNFLESFPDRVYASQLLPLMNAQKRLGEKTGKGFYQYDAKRKQSNDAEGIAPILAQARQAASALPAAACSAAQRLSDAELVEFIFFPVVNEACRVLAEGIIIRAADLDIASVLGMGFPPYRGGPLHWADSLGAAHVCDTLKRLEATFGPFFKPCDYLVHCAARNQPLSAGVNNAGAAHATAGAA